ncbi:hypothetical protein HOB10_04475 [Candidatus Parcubacteria bacterium]|jgi:hypothetical protein|nr:hypothetical protein [Candidatus Parcubacteria bacterium]
MPEKDQQEQLQNIYDEYIVRLNALKKEQSKIINDFINEVEQKKLAKLRENL